MSLRVWLPLTKDLRNQGLSNVTVTNNGATYSSTGGKLGGCYSFGTGASAISLPTSTFTSLTGDFSVACWVKIISWNTSYATIWAATSTSASWTNIMAGLFRNGSSSKILFCIGNDSSSTQASCITTEDIQLNTWYHFVCTYTSGKICLYQNGNLVSSYNTSIIPKFSATQYFNIGKMRENTYQTNSSINDFRLYDHCLSPMEVKELSKGLVLHYPLNRGGFGNENLLSRYVVPGQAGPTSTATGGRTTWLGDYKITIPATENADTYFRLFMSEQLVSGQTYTISCQVDGLLSGSVYRFPMFAQSNTAMGVLNLDHNGLNSLTFTMNWTGTQTAATGANGETVYVNFLDDSARIIASGQGPITISNFKLDEGDKVTPWCPNILDSLYDAMGLNGTTEYDTSGYCNNGTRTGTFSWTSDTPKYAVSTKFDTTSSKIQLPTMDFSGMANSYTFAWWQYNVSTGNMPWGFSNGNRLNCYHCSPLCWNTGDGSSNQFKNGSSTVAPTEVQNGWHHMVVTGDGTSTKLYIDGVYRGTATTYKALTGTQIWISGWDSGTSYTFNGSKESDFRIYATALSADDVKSLYQNSAYIDSSGNVYGAVHSEV